MWPQGVTVADPWCNDTRQIEQCITRQCAGDWLKWAVSLEYIGMFVKSSHCHIKISSYHFCFTNSLCDRYLDIDGMWCYVHIKLVLLLSCYLILLQLSSPPPPLTTVLVQLPQIEFMGQKSFFDHLIKKWSRAGCYLHHMQL